jgi:hypothetical protein
MATARDTTAEHIKPLTGSIVRRYTAGATIAAGELVSMSSDGYIDPSDCTAGKNPVLGVAVQAAGAAGERVDVVTFGPVVCLTGATPGGLQYNSTTAGEPLETTAGNQTVAGIAESATILFVRPSNA